MTPPERAALSKIGELIFLARYDPSNEFKEAALEEAMGLVLMMAKQKPWQPKAGRYYLVDAPRGNGTEITPAELRRLIRLLEAAIRTHWVDSRKGMVEDGELLEKLRGL